MIVHFICRGNAFRSIIAEAYLHSLRRPELTGQSSGAVAAAHKERNRASYHRTLELLEEHGLRGFAKNGYGEQLTQAGLDRGDVTVCLNERVYEDSRRIVTFAAPPRVWSVADLGEPGRVVAADCDPRVYREQAYQEIAARVEGLVAEVGAG